MSETVQVNQLQRIATLLSHIAETLRNGFQQMINTLNRVAQIQTQISAINRQFTSATFFKDNTPLGATTDMHMVNQIISDMFSGKKDLFPGMTPAGGMDGKKEQKGIKALFSSIGSSMKAAFGPMALIMQILSPLINAFLEPMDLMSPLFEQWGMILSQLLYPIILALMPALEQLTPIFESLIFALMPIVMVIVNLIVALTPLLSLISMVVTVVFSWIGGLTSFLGIFSMMLAHVQNFFQNMKNVAQTWVSDAINGVKNFGTRIRDTLAEGVQEILDRVKEKFQIFKGGGLDNNTETWW